ncbi:MAG: hypothetical protein HYR89_01545 [Actinobacteria bacterium]|nr:hypothetical protein [Actinomycetota bacterium]
MNLTGKSIAELLPSPASALAPLRAIGRALASPGLARDHPLSRDLRTFLANGYEIVDFVLTTDPPSVDISLRRAEDLRRIESDDLVFVTYAAGTVPRERSRARVKANQNGGLS